MIDMPELLFHVLSLLLLRCTFYIEHAVNFNDIHTYGLCDTVQPPLSKATSFLFACFPTELID